MHTLLFLSVYLLSRRPLCTDGLQGLLQCLSVSILVHAVSILVHAVSTLASVSLRANFGSCPILVIAPAISRMSQNWCGPVSGLRKMISLDKLIHHQKG